MPVCSDVMIEPDEGCCDDAEAFPNKREAAIKRVEIVEIMVFVFLEFVIDCLKILHSGLFGCDD